MGFPLAVGSDEVLLQIKRRIADSYAFDQCLHLVFQMDRAKVIDLDSADDCSDSHHIPSTYFIQKNGSSMLKIAEIDPIIDMQVAIDIRKSNLNRRRKGKLVF